MSRTRAIEEAAQDVQLWASQWVMEREMSDNWSETDQTCLDNWLQESSSHRVAYWRAKHAWNKTERMVALRPSARWEGDTRNGRARSIFTRVSAAAIILSAAAFAISRGVAPTYVTYTTPIGGHKVLSLSDGSHIELNTNSVLRVSNAQGHREAILDSGEAYFDIKHDAAAPFLIKVGGRRIVDVGTRFIVRTEAGSVKLSMLEGRVTLSAAKENSGAPTELKGGEVAVATLSATTVFKLSGQALSDTQSWRQGHLVFRHVPLSEAIAEFNRYNRNQLVVANADAAKLKIHGSFRTDDVQGFADIVQEVLHLQVSHVGDKIVMSR
jgi:transmembrane sensor